MNIKLVYPGLFLVFALLFSACGGGDDKAVALPITNEASYLITIEVAGIKGTTAPPLVNVVLDSIIGKENAQNLLSANDQSFQRGKSYLGVYGLKGGPESVVLKNFTITVGSNIPVNLGTCSLSGSTEIGFLADVDQSGDLYTNVIQALFNDLVQRRKSTVKISYDANEDIARESKVLFKLNMGGIYKYNTYINK